MAPISTLPEIIFSSSIFIPTWLLLRDKVRRGGSFPQAKQLLFCHNCFQVLLSLIILTTILLSILPPSTIASLPHSLQSVVQIVQSHNSYLPRYLYHISKTYEYVDILLFVSNGGHTGQGDIDIHFILHHLTTPYLGLFRFLRHYDGWQVFAALNATHHAFMYAFFAGAKWTMTVLKYTRYGQLVIGMACDALVASAKMRKGVEIWPNVFSAGLLATYLVLLMREIAMKRKLKIITKVE